MINFYELWTPNPIKSEILLPQNMHITQFQEVHRPTEELKIAKIQREKYVFLFDEFGTLPEEVVTSSHLLYV